MRPAIANICAGAIRFDWYRRASEYRNSRPSNRPEGILIGLAQQLG
jgi:hypothetical protein